MYLDITSTNSIISRGLGFVSIEEDGLPVAGANILYYGPSFSMRSDATLDRIEAVRGGSAAVIGVNARGVQKLERSSGSCGERGRGDFDRMTSRIPTYLLLGIFAGWLNRHQQAIIEYLRTENEILKRQLNGRRPRLTDEERRLLAVKGKALGRKVLEAVVCIVTPDTILAWHRRLVALKWTFSRGRVGRPRVAHEVRDLILEMARTEPRWGYTSIRDRLRNLGHRVSRATVANILKAHGLEPAPKRSRRTSWSAFLKAQWAGLAAMDFTTVEVWTTGGLVTHYVAFVMELATRKVVCAGITPYPDAAWMQQIGRNLTDAISGFLLGKRLLIMDRDALYHAGFLRLLEQAGIRSVRTPPSAPNCNAHLERFHGSFKREAADRVIFLGETHLQRVVDEYLIHYHCERNHQGLDGRIIDAGEEVGMTSGKIYRRQRLGGLFNYYYRAAA
jgi:transposase InsO family protein